MPPFSRDQFFAVFAAYNANYWPISVLAYLAALAALGLLLIRHQKASLWLTVLMAAMWAWTGVFYHALYFARINPAAYAFAGLFLAEAILLARYGFKAGRLHFARWLGWRAAAGWALFAYTMIAYPLIGLANGHTYKELPQFGVTPCPVTLFTLGALLLAKRPMPMIVSAIPVIWSLIGGSAAILLAVPQDWPLLAGGAATLLVLYLSHRSETSSTA